MKSLTNMLVLKKTRRKPESGDIFVFQVAKYPERFFYGRVVATDTTIGNITEIGVVLVYLYRTSSPDKICIPSLSISELLVPPFGTNTLAWTRGYFEVVKSGDNSSEVLPQHCFKDSGGRFFDEYGNRLPGPIEPVGVYGLFGIEGIDAEIGRALGLN